MPSKFRHIALATAGCATIVTAAAYGGGEASAQAVAKPAPVQAISAKDRADGAKAHPQLLEEFGGAETGPQAGYVETFGQNTPVQPGPSNAPGGLTGTGGGGLTPPEPPPVVRLEDNLARIFLALLEASPRARALLDALSVKPKG